MVAWMTAVFIKNKCCADYKACCGGLDYSVTRAGKFAYGSCLASLKHLSVSMRANISEPCLRASQDFVTNLTRCSDVSFYKIHARI